MKAKTLLPLMAVLLACKNEVPCRGHDECPVQSDLTGRDDACCCGDQYVDRETLNQIEAQHDKDMYTAGGCGLSGIYCKEAGDLYWNLYCQD
jgi:hypothetical protein